MKNTVSVGPNRTGIGTSPIDSAAMIKNANEKSPPDGHDGAIHEVRAEYTKSGMPVGTVPPPATAKGVATAAKEVLKGRKPTVFIDKLGERLAFERTGTRLYEALIGKFDSLGTWKGGPSRADLQEIHGDELKHFAMLGEVIAQLGADPTAVTPCADIASVESIGLMQVLTDPRTTLPQCLQAMLIAELADTAGWEMLVMLARELGHEELAKRFEVANQVEMKHLGMVRTWLTTQMLDEATRDLEQQPAE